MKLHFPNTLCLTLGLFLATIMPAQNLPSLPKAAEIRTGTLGKGDSYYLVTNKAVGSKADFALVTDAVTDITVLEDLPHFDGVEPWMMLARGGADTGPDGWFSNSDRGSLFHFRGVPSGDKVRRDSTLLLLFDLMAEIPGRHAVIIAGDIDADATAKDLVIFSMMLPSPSENESAPYRWSPGTAPTVTVSTADGIPFVEVTWKAERIPAEQMPTIIPYITEQYASELGDVVTRRVERSLREQRIPYGTVTSDYVGSAETDGDEMWSVKVTAPSGHLLDVARTIASSLSTVERDGVTAAEYSDAHDAFSARRSEYASRPVRDNGEYIEKCASAFLRGSDLASKVAVEKYFSARTMPDSTQLRLFNSYCSALLAPEGNMSLAFRTDSALFSPANALAEFRHAWKNAPALKETYDAAAPDTLGLSSHSGKTRIKNEQPDPISGGTIWTTPSGIKVIWRHMDTPGVVHWGWLLKGGFVGFDSIGPGEGAFLSDLMSLYSVGGLSASGFADMLESNGISLSTDVSLTGIRLEGSVPPSRVDLLVRVLVALSKERLPDEAAFRDYLAAEMFRLDGGMTVSERMKTILRPDDRYTMVKAADNLKDDLQERAEAYFEERFSRVDEGVLVFAGDIEEAELRRILTRHLGNFRTSSSRKGTVRISRQTISGTVVRTEKGSPECISTLISLPLNYTGENRMAAYMAATMLRDRLAVEMVPWGISVDFRTEVSAFPDERFDLYLTGTRVLEGSVPECLLRPDLSEAVAVWRKVLKEAGSMTPSAPVLSAFKSGLVAEIASELKDPKGIVEAVIVRYADGKDVVTRYKERIDAVTASRVQEILAAFSKAPRVEYIVQ